MNKRFVPIDYLGPSDVEIFKEARRGIRHALATRNKDSLSHYEAILDKLLEKAIENYKTQKSGEPVAQ